MVEEFIEDGRTESGANSKLIDLAKGKFRSRDNEDIDMLKGQFGELMLFNFLQYFFKAVPVLRKMPITTSPLHERFGADAIHYRKNEEEHLFFLGEAKTYDKSSFRDAICNGVESIIGTYLNHRKELDLYLYDFIDEKLKSIVKSYKRGTLENSKINLVCIIAYSEKDMKIGDNDAEIQKNIFNMIKKRCEKFNNENLNKHDNKHLDRIHYIIFPFWEFEELLKKFQKKIGG